VRISVLINGDVYCRQMSQMSYARRAWRVRVIRRYLRLATLQVHRGAGTVSKWGALYFKSAPHF